MSALSPLNPRLLNEQGESPLHVAVSQPDSDALLEAMLETFHKPEKGLDINQPRSDGETLLHIAAQRGAADQVKGGRIRGGRERGEGEVGYKQR
jgi:ankyrin repeat protein